MFLKRGAHNRKILRKWNYGWSSIPGWRSAPHLLYVFSNKFANVSIKHFEGHGVKVRPGSRDPGTRDSGSPSKFKSETQDPLKFKSETPRPPSKFKSGIPGTPNVFFVFELKSFPLEIISWFFPTDPANFSASDRPGGKFLKVWEGPKKKQT